MIELAEALSSSGWLPSSADRESSFERLSQGVDVLPLLLEATQRSLGAVAGQRAEPSKTPIRPRRAGLSQALAAAIQRGAALTFGWPGCGDRPWNKWLRPRLLWWPRGIPDGRKVAWVSSRLARAIDERPDWLAVLRSATAKLDPARDVLLTAPSTTVDRFLERAAILFGLRRLRVHLDERRSLVEWLTRLRRQLQRNSITESLAEQLSHDSDVFVSPPVGWALLPVPHATNTDGQECPSDELPLRDRVLIAAADQVFALQVRPNGNLHRMLRARLNDSAWPTASVWLALGDSLVPRDIAEELQALGAVGWWLFVEHVDNVLESPPATGTLETCPTIAELPWAVGEYLVHWTRRRDGPWPGQSDAEFIDDLLLLRESASHSAFAALSRIVQQRRLVASATGIRGDVAVVSFSAKTLSELTKQRTFRAHRGRWDCEAYGLCVRREWLQARGAKPVLYGNDPQWATLTDSERPFFQLETTRSRGGAKTIDWTHEAEWRVPQDVDLSEASRDDVVLFVPTDAEARQLAAVSPWPVLVVS